MNMCRSANMAIIAREIVRILRVGHVPIGPFLENFLAGLRVLIVVMECLSFRAAAVPRSGRRRRARPSRDSRRSVPAALSPGPPIREGWRRRGFRAIRRRYEGGVAVSFPRPLGQADEHLGRAYLLIVTKPFARSWQRKI